MKIIGVAGGSGSGKTTFAQLLRQSLGGTKTLVLAQDSYYRDQSSKFDKDGGQVNFDHPDSIDWALLGEHLIQLKKNKVIQSPIYDFATHKRAAKTVEMHPTPFIILDGILIYTQKDLLPLIDHKIYIDCSESVRFSRREKRDVAERGRTVEGVRAQLQSHVKPMHDLFVEPSKKYADIVISGESDFTPHLNQFLKHLLG